MSTVSEKIAAGVYRTKLPIPTYGATLNADVDAYYGDRDRLFDLLKADLEEECGTEHLPVYVRAALYSKAHSYGECQGHSAVATIYAELSGVVLAAFTAGQKEHVSRMVQNTENGYQPSGSDLFHPELWRAPHWRWFIGGQAQIQRTPKFVTKLANMLLSFKKGK